MVRQLLKYKSTLKRFIPRPLREKLIYSYGSRLSRQISAQRQGIAVDLCAKGVTLIGDLQGASGLAEASRGLRTGFQQGGVPLATCDFSPGALEQVSSSYAINLIHANPNQLPQLCVRMNRQQWLHRYNIGFWVFEQEEIPKDWKRFFPLFDEIWTPSSFAAAAIGKATDLPVTVVPHIIDVQFDAEKTRRDFGLPQDLFLCLIAYDCDSVSERKNPEGAIRAFCAAYADCKNQVGLVIKARGATPVQVSAFHERLKDWPYVYVLTQDFEKKEMNTLIHQMDVYLSLHRAEGFGLILAEAMYLGIPVVTTNWSGNTEFMNKDVACMVDAKLITLEQDYPPFVKGSRWAEPDEAQAEGYLKKLFENPDERKRLGATGKRYVSEKLGSAAVSQIMANRVQEIEFSLLRSQ